MDHTRTNIIVFSNAELALIDRVLCLYAAGRQKQIDEAKGRGDHYNKRLHIADKKAAGQLMDRVGSRYVHSDANLEALCVAHHAERTKQGFTTAPWDQLEERNRQQYRDAMSAAFAAADPR